MPESQLILNRNMPRNVVVSFKGETTKADPGPPVILDWRSEYQYMVLVEHGRWRFSDLQLGTRQKTQRQGFCSEGTSSLLELENIRIRNASTAGAGIAAQRGGRTHLYGKIELNEDLHDECKDLETYSRVYAGDHGTVQFVGQGPGTLLSVGHGSLSTDYYGCIRLGCERAKITTWDPGGNNLGIANSGRIDLHGTETHLRGMHEEAGLIGLEDDGHILAEETHVILEHCKSRHAIYLQKASKVFGGPFEMRGKFQSSVVTMSGSVFGGTVTGDVTEIHAYTGSHITLESRSSKPTGRVVADSGASITLPSGKVVREQSIPPGGQPK
ncbi:MAG: hypothetical protein NTU53_19545 [Planctomycetota bacterium]|nr:hypothetical protein [Planctomycetota bacterium]